LLDCDLLNAIEVAYNIIPLDRNACCAQSLIQFLAQQQGKE
jgi:hypothetical protein